MAIFCAATTVTYVETGAQPVPIMEWLLTAGPVLMTILWICQDAQRRRIAAVTDLGFLLIVFWPFAIPWYVFRSRGWSGWKLLLGLPFLMFPTHLTALALYVRRLS
jgi:hypothetical protein